MTAIEPTASSALSSARRRTARARRQHQDRRDGTHQPIARRAASAPRQCARRGGMLTVMSSAGMSDASGRPSIILDCDPGHDDAVAIVAAARFADLVGITTVAGNAPLDRTTRNALVMRDLLGIDVPVHSGSDRPLVGRPTSHRSSTARAGSTAPISPTPTTPARRDRRRRASSSTPAGRPRGSGSYRSGR